MPEQPLNIRLVIQITADEEAAIRDFQFGNRINGRSEAVRQIIAAGLNALGGGMTAEPLDNARADDERVDAPPRIPSPDQCGRPVLGEVILPWLRQQGRREYTQDEVLTGVFGETANAPGRDATVRALFKAIGWKQHTTRRGGVTTRTFTAPDA